MKIQSITGFLFVLIMASCGGSETKTESEVTENTSDEISRIWRFSNVILDADEEGVVDGNRLQSMNKIFKDQGFLFALFPDGKYVEILGKDYRNGSWEKLSEIQILVNDGQHQDTINILEYFSNDEETYLVTEYKGNGKFQFSPADLLSDYTTDPFYPANNTWRIKPAAEESGLELKKRVRNYTNHMALLLKASIDRDAKGLSFRSSRGPMRIYNGGIGAKKEENIPEEWKAGFYNDDQAMQGYQIFKDYLKAKKYKAPRDGGWVEKDYDILLQLLEVMDGDIGEQ